MLDVCEVFTSIQGEGPMMGKPAVFLRLAGCVPPFCSNCDTPQSLVPGKKISGADLLLQLMTGPELVVVTGGEPFLQWNTGLSDLCRQLTVSGKQLQFETSGKVSIPSAAPGMVVCSPKPMKNPCLSPELIVKTDVFKFIIEDTADHVLDLVKKWDIPAKQVWLMPEGKTRAEQLKKMPGVWELAKTHGFHFSPRLHILTFNDKAGI